MLRLDIFSAEMNRQFDLTFEESEGKDCIRFDMGQRSIWVYESGSIENLDCLSGTSQKKVREIERKATAPTLDN